MLKYCFQQIRLTLTWRTIAADSLTVSETVCVQSLSSDPGSASPLIIPSVKLTHLHLLGMIQPHTDTGTAQCLLGQTTDPCLDCFQFLSTPLGDEGTKPAQSSKCRADAEEQEIHRYRGAAKLLMVSFTPLSVWSHIWFTFLFWTFSTRFYGTDHSLLFSVSHLLSQFQPNQQLCHTAACSAPPPRGWGGESEKKKLKLWVEIRTV